ncbi:hypothetical protein AKJ16_DCAP16339 [Drosera capensis]
MEGGFGSWQRGGVLPSIPCTRPTIRVFGRSVLQEQLTGTRTRSLTGRVETVEEDNDAFWVDWTEVELAPRRKEMLRGVLYGASAR